MKLKILIGILLFLILVNLATIGTYLYLHVAKAQQQTHFLNRRMGDPFFRPEGPGFELRKGQREKMFQLLTKLRQQTRKQQEQIRELEDDALQIMQENQVPQQQLDEILRKIADLRLEISRNAARNLIAAKSFLTPEQQAHFFNAIMRARPGPADHRPLNRGRPSHRKPPGPGMNRNNLF